MPEWNSFLLFVGAGLLLNITPGPDVLYIVGRSLGQGRVAGVVSALGLSAVMLAVQRLEPVPLARIFRQGVVTNVLNPKVALFFLAFLPQFTDAARGPAAAAIRGLGLVFVANGTMVCLGYALAASWLGDWLKSRYGFSTWLNRVMGGLFIALGLRLALEKR